jgi:hypothetical protein
MPVGLLVAALLAPAVSVAAPAPTSVAATPAPTTGAKPPVKTADDGCSPTKPDADTRAIVICAQRPNGYRIDPDILKARREKRQNLAGRPHNPHETFADRSCGTVGPMPCFNAGINLIAAAVTAAEMAKRLAEGKEIGSMFVTDPQPSEYQLYLQAKHEREAEEAAKAAKAKAKTAAQAK